MNTLPSGALTPETLRAFKEMDRVCVAAINAAVSQGVPQGLIVGLLHGYAHVQTAAMMSTEDHQ